jgi:hypothetical protein
MPNNGRSLHVLCTSGRENIAHTQTRLVIAVCLLYLWRMGEKATYMKYSGRHNDPVQN